MKNDRLGLPFITMKEEDVHSLYFQFYKVLLVQICYPLQIHGVFDSQSLSQVNCFNAKLAC